MAAVRRGQEVGVWVAWYTAEVYATPVGRGWQGPLQGARARVPAQGL